MMDRLYKCLGNSNRRKIIYCIGDGEKCVNEISECLELEQSLVSHHLKELVDCGIVEKHRDGKKIYYQVSELKIIELLEKGKEIGDDLEGSC